MADVNDKSYRARVFDMVRLIPKGRLMTYGQIATLLGEGYTARTVGYVMHDAETDVPWQRVINAQGKVSTERILLPYNVQQQLLEQEGVVFNDKGKCNVDEYRFKPEGYEEEDEQPTLFGD
jgi:methylated-DNA-protein-cysteine methyltransferase-like protein